MTREITPEPVPIRRVVTGNDEHGRSCVLFDSAAPNVNPGAISRGTCMTDVWVYQTAPAIISGFRDDGNLMLFCCERDVDVKEYREVLEECIRYRNRVRPLLAG